MEVVRCSISRSPIIHLAVALPGGELGGTLCGRTRRDLIRADTEQPACEHCAQYAERAGVRPRESDARADNLTPPPPNGGMGVSDAGHFNHAPSRP